MVDVNLSERDIDLIGRVVDTEVPRSIAKRNPYEYNRMVGAVVDTVTNRLATGRYGATIPAVLNERRAFSKITGPSRLSPYGSAEAAPRASRKAQQAVNEHLAKRAGGVPSSIGGSLNYANPNFSDRSNLRGWIGPMIARGATRLGIGNAVHYHGTPPGVFPAPPTNVSTPAGFMPQVDPGNMTYYRDAPVPSARPMPSNEMVAGTVPSDGQLAAFASGDVAPYADVGFRGFDGVQRAPLTTPVRPAPSMPRTAELSPLKPSLAIGPTAESIAPPSTAELAAAYGKMGADMQSVGVNRLGMMPAPSMPAPNSAVSMPQSRTIAPAEIAQTNQAVPQSLPNSAQFLPNSAEPRAIPAGLSAGFNQPRGDPFGSTASMDNFGNSLVTNRYGVTTATMPDGKQAAYGKGTAGPLGRTSLLGNVGMPGGASGLVGGLLGAAIGSAIAGPVGGMIGGLAGKSLIGGNLGGGGFPAAPGTFGEKQGKGLTQGQRADISPAASRSMGKNGGKMTGLW